MTSSEELEMAAVAIARDASFIACAPAHRLAPNRQLIEDAREALNDALAKIDRASQRMAA